jgi:hypothetical protein
MSDRDIPIAGGTVPILQANVPVSIAGRAV